MLATAFLSRNPRPTTLTRSKNVTWMLSGLVLVEFGSSGGEMAGLDARSRRVNIVPICGGSVAHVPREFGEAGNASRFNLRVKVAVKARMS